MDAERAKSFADAWRAEAGRDDGTTVRLARSLKTNVSTLYRWRREAEAALEIKLPTMTGSPHVAARVRHQMALQGISPEHDMVHGVPDGFTVKGVSTYYDEDGKVRGQWVKSQQDQERAREIMREAVQAMADELPRLKSERWSGGKVRSDICAGYPIGDAHVGMLAWAEECGESWDLRIAERVHCEAMNALVEAAPACETALIANVGDFFHYDNLLGVTERSKNVLDRDGRYSKMIRVGVKIARQGIASALRKHKRVHYIGAPGNHDETAAFWLCELLRAVYENEPRVTIETSPAPHLYYEFGRVLVGVTHGDKAKLDALPGVMAADRPEAWGRTAHRYWWTGHIHTQTVKEHPGVTVESFNTLAAKDAYATAGGWRARQNMKCLVLHREHGEVARHTVNAQMFAPAQEAA